MASAEFRDGLRARAGDADMARSVGLLRAVNVGGRKLAMADLRRITEAAGGRDVETYLQSGNVVFAGGAGVSQALERAIADEFGLDVAVLVRSAKALAGVVAAKPFGAEGAAVSVTFLSAAPARALVSAIDPAAYGADEFVVHGKEIYIHTPDGYGRSKLVNAFWERKLKVAATTRNWNTVLALTEMASR